MKKGILPWIIGGAAIVFITLSRKKQIAKTMQYSFEKIGIDLKKRAITITLGLLNPAQGSVRINSVVGTLRVNGKDVATVTQFKPVTVAGNAKTMLPLSLAPSAYSIYDLIKSYIFAKKQGEKVGTKVTFVGNSNVDGMTLPINTTLG